MSPFRRVAPRLPPGILFSPLEDNIPATWNLSLLADLRHLVNRSQRRRKKRPFAEHMFCSESCLVRCECGFSSPLFLFYRCELRCQELRDERAHPGGQQEVKSGL